MMNSRIRKSRLTRLANKIESNLKWEFDMDTWGYHYGNHAPPEKNYCGTAACALGTAALMPEFRRAGLRSKWVKDPHTRDEWSLNIGPDDDQDRTSVTAYGARFFGLTFDEAYDLFLGTHRSRRDVVRLIRELADIPYNKEADSEG